MTRVWYTRWMAPKAFSLTTARMLMGYRRRYDKGERVCVLHALDACLNNGYLPEPWMLKGLWDAVTALDDGADPNEAFGYVRPRGKHIETNRAKNRKMMPILFYVYDLHCNQGLASGRLRSRERNSAVAQEMSAGSMMPLRLDSSFC